MSKLLQSLTFQGDGSCWRTIRQSTFTTLTSLSFLLCSVGLANAQGSNCEPILTCPADITVECGTDITDLSIVGLVSVEDNGNCAYTVTISDNTTNGNPCNTVVVRTFVVTSTDGSAAICTQTITIQDTQGPVFPGFMPTLNYQCADDVMEPGDCIAEDCNAVVLCDNFQTHTGGDTLNCSGSLALGQGIDWSLWLHGLQSAGLASNDYYRWVPGTVYMSLYDDGTAHLWGEVVNLSNPSEGWICHFWMENGTNWSNWSSMGRSFKDDLGLGAPFHTFWTYYELVGGFSNLQGVGDNAGSSLSLSHMPSSYYFGFQCGQAANNRNGNMGLSGWFYYSGWVVQDGVSTYVQDHGDVTTDKSCIPNNPNNVCEDEFTRFYRAIDQCGNETLLTQTITIEDTIFPTFVNCPESFSIECDLEIPAAIPASELMATDNCADSLVVVLFDEGTVVMDDECNSHITRVYYVEDDCLNRTFCTYTISIVDTTAPVITAPADATFECDEEIVYAPATATDNCHQAIVTEGESETIAGECPQEYTIIRYFTATDGCGNYSYATQTINVVDTTAPVFNPYPVEVWVECTEVDLVPVPTATDNCDLEVTVTFTSEIGSGGCLGILVRYLTATDDCGNTATAEQYIYIQDTTPPVINEPADMTVECNMVPEAPGEGGAEIYDNCGYEVSVEFHTEMLDGPCTDSYTILWIWDATDYCDNMSSDTTVITVVDTTNPTIEVGQGGSFSCDQDIIYATPSATDNCDTDVTIVSTPDTTAGNCPQSYTIVVTHVATDNCGNSSVAYSTYNVYDETAPVFTETPVDVTIECDEAIPASSATAIDNCGAVTITQSQETMLETLCHTHIVRTFVATDECGNYSTYEQNIHIYDTTAPVISGPSTLEIPCEEFSATSGIYVTAADNCNEFSLVIDSTLQVSGECAGVYMRYYSATDVCENQSESFVQIIYLTDTIAPVGNEPEDITVLCSDEIPSFDPMFTDNCGGVVDVVYNGFEITEICNVTYTETWTATDNCGNVTVIDRNVTIYDNVNPWFENFPADATISCEMEAPAVVYPMAYDNCDMDVEIELGIDTLPGTCPNEMTIYRVFRAFDNCGNQVVQTQTITVIDETAPVFDGDNQDSFQYECDEEADVIQPTATDNCGEIVYTYVDGLYYEVECYRSFERVWTATDACGNFSTFTQLIYFLDTTPPVITGPSLISVPCEQFSLTEGIFVTATDNCNTVNIVIDSTQQVSGQCGGTFIRYYTAYDFCQNVSLQFEQIISVTDTTAPVVDAEPIDATYECDQEWSPASPVFTDNCTEITLTANVVQTTDGCTTVFTYIWTATDNCDNSTSVDQVITVTDTTAPVASFDPEDFTVECGQFWDVVVPTFTDNCDDELTYDSGSSEEQVGCNIAYTFWWSATDNCNNTTIVGNTVTVEDTTAPVLTVPNGGEFSCDEDIIYSNASATDVCDDDVTITFADDTIAGNCPQSYTIVRTWYATDDCLNQSVGTTSYYVNDYTAPEFTSVPADITVECDLPIPASSATATDNCGLVTVTSSDSDVMQDECDGYIVRTFTAEDECGNTSQADQIIDIIDTTAPVLVMPNPNTATIPCTQVFLGSLMNWAAGNGTAEDVAMAHALFTQLNLLPTDVTDNCDPNAYYLESGLDVSFDVECPNVAMLTCTFVPYDNCGNSGLEMSSYIYIIDETAPVLTNPAEDEFIECDQEPSGWSPVFDDECNDNITVLPISSITTDGCTTMIHQSWTASDPCGNSITVTHNITITDTTYPVVTAPADITISCEQDLVWGNATYSDNCDEDLTVTSEDVVTPGDCPNEYTVTRTWSVTDNCNNTSFASASITVVDNDAPYFTSTPNDVTIECDEVIPPSEATAADACGTASVTQEDFVAYESDCYTVVNRNFTAVDLCGNYAYYTQTITIVDTTAPVLSGPSQVSITCEEFNMLEGTFVTATDNCNETWISIDSTLQVSGECAGVYMRYYTAYDICQNASEQFLQIIYLTDTIAPVGNEPLDVTISCDETAPLFDPMWTDNCGGELTLSHTMPQVNGYCGVSYTETWTATDNCGNIGTVDRIVTIVDEVAPVINDQNSEITIACNLAIDYAIPTATDNCDTDVEVTASFLTIPGNCPGNYTEVITFTATDECDNTSSVTHIIHYEDVVAPELSNVPFGNEYSCDQDWTVGTPTVTDNCTEPTLVTSIDTIPGTCPNNYQVVYTWYAYDECDNVSESVSATIYVYDYTAPTFNNTPTNESYECLDWSTYTVQTVTASDNCGSASVVPTIETIYSDTCGNGMWNVYYTATDLCGNSAYTQYTINVYDETAPVLSAMPADLVIDCNDEIPAAQVLTATDNCNGLVNVVMTETCIGECPQDGQDNACDMVQPDLGSNPCNYIWNNQPAQWSMALFSLGSNYKYYTLDENYTLNSFVVNTNGTIDVTCRVISCFDSNGGFDINVTFGNAKDWSEWSTQTFPTGFKADCAGEAANHTDWMYYILQQSPDAEVVGWGSFAGSALNVAHAPSNNYFGFQYGDGANNLSAGTGLGGWFTFSGTLLHNGQPINNNGGSVSGAGDFAWELDCCPDYYVVRCWSASDCTGNEVSWCQTISFADLDGAIPPVVEPTAPANALGGISIVAVAPNPATEKSVISFTSELEGKLSLQVMDMTGRIVADLFNNTVEANTIYRADFNAAALESGMYLVRLSSGSEQKVERIQIVR
jgi:hypothetical protein